MLAPQPQPWPGAQTQLNQRTAFVTPWGRFRYKVLPQAYLASMVSYMNRFSLITEDMRDKVTTVYDTLLWSDYMRQDALHFS